MCVCVCVLSLCSALVQCTLKLFRAPTWVTSTKVLQMDSHEKAELDMENDYEIFFSYTPVECCAACNEVNYSALLTPGTAGSRPDLDA
jgi:hypothetical protein